MQMSGCAFRPSFHDSLSLCEGADFNAGSGVLDCDLAGIVVQAKFLTMDGHPKTLLVVLKERLKCLLSSACLQAQEVIAHRQCVHWRQCPCLKDQKQS